MEQTLYAQEGINIPGTAFVDNQPTLDLLELKGTGIFSMVDEEISVPKGSDEGVLQKILTKHSDGKHPNCIRPKTKDCKDFLKNFGILHYAGPVFYNISNLMPGHAIDFDVHGITFHVLGLGSPAHSLISLGWPVTWDDFNWLT